MSSFGQIFKISTFGESHCKAVGVVLENCPPNLPLSAADIQTLLDRRRPGQSSITTPRDEKDKVTILSGTELGFTLGSPIAMTVNNLDHIPGDYGNMNNFPRPSHADYSYLMKYGIKSSSGGGRSSARETIGRVAAGAVAEKYLTIAHGIEIVASVGDIDMDPTIKYNSQDQIRHLQLWQKWWDTLKTISRQQVDENITRCPDKSISDLMETRIKQAQKDKDSIGGTVVCVIRNVPAGLGEPSFDKLEAMLAHAMLSIPATKGFEVGSGFKGVLIPGSIHNDMFYEKDNGSLGTRTNFSGGIQGGITNGEDIYFKVSFKSVATIGIAQDTATYNGEPGVLEAKGRHDPCVLPRAVPIVEAMASLVVMDALMLQNSRASTRGLLSAKDVPSVLRGGLNK